MTLQGWRESVVEAVRRSVAGDDELLELTALVLWEADQAKQHLRDKGYGCTGLGIVKTVALVPYADGREA